MSWEQVIDQPRVKRILSAIVRGDRVAHAYLFTGPEGVGKYAAALELARAVNCDRPDGGPCGTCDNCKRIAALQYPDVHLVFALPVGKNEKAGDSPIARLADEDVTLIQEQLRLKAANSYHRIVLPRATTIKLSSMREVRRESALSSFGRGRKVFIILDAEMMNDESSNALLKTLEEPAGDLMIILITTRPELLLPTIISRCQLIRFDPPRDESIASALVEREHIEPAQAAAVASLAAGSYTRAIEYLHSDLAERRREAVDFLRTVLYRPRGELLDAIDHIAADLERSEVEDMLRLMLSWLREAMRASQGIATQGGDDDSVLKFARHYDRLDYEPIFGALDRAVSLIGKNVYIPLILIDLAVRLRNLISADAGAPADAY